MSTVYDPDSYPEEDVALAKALATTINFLRPKATSDYLHSLTGMIIGELVEQTPQRLTVLEPFVGFLAEGRKPDETAPDSSETGHE